MVDVYRLFRPHQKGAFTCWNQATGARSSNLGTRIDFVLCTPSFALDHMIGCDIDSGQAGSDHCPVIAHLREGKYPIKYDI
jgi:AP endonuclease-2